MCGPYHLKLLKCAKNLLNVDVKRPADVHASAQKPVFPVQNCANVLVRAKETECSQDRTFIRYYFRIWHDQGIMFSSFENFGFDNYRLMTFHFHLKYLHQVN